MKDYRVIQIAAGEDPVVEDLNEADVTNFLRKLLVHAKSEAHSSQAMTPVDPASHTAELLDFSTSMVGPEWYSIFAVSLGGMTTACFRRRKLQA